MPNVSVSLLKLVCATASKKGIEIQTLLDRIDLKEEILHNPENYIPCSLLGKAMHEATLLTNDPNFSLDNGQNFEPGDLSVVGYLIANAPTLRRAYEMKLRYKRLIGEGIFWTIEEDNQFLNIYLDTHPELEEYKRYSLDSCMATLVAFKRRLLGKQVNPIAVHFEHAKPGNTSGYDKFFNCRIFFNAERTKIIYPVSVLDEKILHSNPGLFEMFKNYADDFLDNISEEKSISRKVMRLLMDYVPQNRATLENVADNLAIGGRTLQRKLKDEGQTFNEILKDVRKELASRHLQNSQLSISEISYLLGFSEPSIFHRSFKKWTGVTPKDYRRGILAA